MKIQLRLSAGLAAGWMLLAGCGGNGLQRPLEEDVSQVSQLSEEVKENWEPFCYSTDAFEADYSLPAGWSSEDGRFLDQDGREAGGIDGELAAVFPSSNANNFYMTLELSGLVPQKPVTGSRRRIGEGEDAFFCQQYYEEDLPQPYQVVYEYYLPAGEASCLRMELYAAEASDSDTQQRFDAIAESFAVRLTDPSQGTSEEVSQTAQPPEGWKKVSYEMSAMMRDGYYSDDSKMLVTLTVPDSWELEYSVLYDTDPAPKVKALFEQLGEYDRAKVGELAVLYRGFFQQDAPEDLPVDAFLDAFLETDQPDYLVKERREQDGQVFYYTKYESHPDSNVITVWYPHAYYFVTPYGVAPIYLYTYEEDAGMEAVFDQIASSAEFAFEPGEVTYHPPETLPVTSDNLSMLAAAETWYHERETSDWGLAHETFSFNLEDMTMKWDASFPESGLDFNFYGEFSPKEFGTFTASLQYGSNGLNSPVDLLFDVEYPFEQEVSGEGEKELIITIHSRTFAQFEEIMGVPLTYSSTAPLS